MVASSSTVSSDSSTSSTTATRIGEVIETSTVGFTAESDALHVLPELGSLVRVRGLDAHSSYFGVVAFGATGGLDTSRRAVRRGGDELHDEAIYTRHPELHLVLRTIFDVATVGFDDGRGPRHTLPPLPVPLHFSVHACTVDQVRIFTQNPRYLAALMNFRGELMADQLLAGHLQWVDRTLRDDHRWLMDSTRRLARLMKRDYDQFVTIMQAIDPE